MEGAGGAQHALQMRGHEGAGCVYSGPAEGVCCRLLFGLFCADLEDRGLARTLWPCRGPARAQLAPHPLACPPALVPLPVGHAHESVAQQLQMPSL